MASRAFQHRQLSAFRPAPGAGPRSVSSSWPWRPPASRLSTPDAARLGRLCCCWAASARWRRSSSMRSGRATRCSTPKTRARRRSRGARQCRLGDHRRRRRGARLQSPSIAAWRARRTAKRRRRPNWRWRANRHRAVLYRLTRGAAEGTRARRNVSRWRRASRSSPRCARCPTSRPPGGSRRGWPRRIAAPSPAAESGAARRRARRADIRRSPICSATRRSAWRSPMPDGKLVDANPRLREILRRARRAARAAASPIWSSSAIAPRVGDLIAQAAQGDSVGSVELRAAGQRRPHRRTVRAARMQRRPRDRSICVDVSEQKALETKFAQSQKMQAVGQLAGGVAHDFNNLLTVIIGNCEFLLMRHQAGDPSFKEINEIHQNALRAATLVGQLLAFSRKQTLQPKVLALRDVIGELALMLRRLLREGIDLKLEHGADLWPVHADEAQLSNAIINLVVNARDAMPKGGTVTIRTANETVTERRGARHRDHAGGRLCAHRSRRHRHRHSQGTSRQDLRSLLHHQAGGPGHGARPCHRLWHRQADRRLHHRRQRSRQGHQLSASICRAIASTRMRRPPSKPSAPRRATSPARTRSCWSRTRKRCAASRRGR